MKLKNKKDVPFYANLKDNNHCFQACLKMVLKCYFPDKNYSFKELDKISKHKKGKWTWQGAALITLAKLGFDVVNIENLDYKKFAKDGDVYLKKIWSDETFKLQNKFSDLNQEQKIAQKLINLKKVELVNKIARMSDVEKYFSKSFFVMVSVNPCVFERKKCYWSHLVLVTGMDRNFITFHDPGLPPVKNKRVSKKIFEKAMTKPWKEDTNLIAVKKIQ